jgi:predicted kinase
MAKVMLICGKICCGKSTYTRRLKEASPAVMLSVDDLVLALFPRELGDAHESVTARAQAYLMARAVDIVSAGTDVILEWGFWGREDRARVTGFFRERGVETQWHYIRVSDEEWDDNIRRRNAAIAAGASSDYMVDENLKAKCRMLFQEPDREEIDVWWERETR